jgi:hypothetical protein
MEFAPIRILPEIPNAPERVICDEKPMQSRRLRFGMIEAPGDSRICGGKLKSNDHMAFAESVLNTYL